MCARAGQPANGRTQQIGTDLCASRHTHTVAACENNLHAADKPDKLPLPATSGSAEAQRRRAA